MKELSKERLLYWVKTKINIINIGEGIVPSKEETQAYRQICNLINSYFLIVNLKSPNYAAGYEQGIFDEKMNQQKRKEEKCEHDWFEITVHDEKYGKTYKCSKCGDEKFEPDEKIKKIKSVAGDIFKTFSLGVLYEKLIATPAVEIKKLVMKEVKDELEQLEKKKVNK